MPVPLFTFFIPGIALYFLVQMILCHVFHFQVQLSHSKNDEPKELRVDSKTHCKNDKNTLKSDKNPSPQRKIATPIYRGGRAKGKVDQTKDSHRDQNNNDQSSIEISSSSNEAVAPCKENRRRQSQESRTSTKSEGRIPTVTFTDLPSGLAEAHSGTSQRDLTRQNQSRKRRQSVFAESYDPSKDNDEDKVVHPKSAEEKQWLEEHLRDVTLFQHLAHDQLTTVVDAMYKYPVTYGEEITKEGDRGNTFYVIQEGVFAVYVRGEDGEEQLVNTYDNEGSFGELALLYNQPRAASVVACSDGTLWAVDGQTFRRIVYRITHQKRMMYENLINNVPMMQQLEPYERANLVDALVPMTFEDGQEIVKQGDEADGMYFIISGGVKVVLYDLNNVPHLLNELSNSDYFGELGLITNKPRVASAISVGTTQLAFLDRDAFERLLGPCMDVMNRNIHSYNEKLNVILQQLKD